MDQRSALKAKDTATVSSRASMDHGNHLLYRRRAAVHNKNSPSPAGFTPCQRRLVSLWASAFVALNFVSLLAQALASASTGIDAKINQCGPISDTIEYLLWLLRNL